jgi:hypothetical protein
MSVMNNMRNMSVMTNAWETHITYVLLLVLLYRLNYLCTARIWNILNPRKYAFVPTCTSKLYFWLWKCEQFDLSFRNSFFFPPWYRSPLAGQGLLIYWGFTILLRNTTLDRTPLDKWSAWRRDLYLIIQNTHKTQTSMLPAGFEPSIPASERPQTHTLDRADTGIATIFTYFSLLT